MSETDLIDFQWQVLDEMVPDTRRRKHLLCLIIKALLCRAKSGYQWPLLHRESSAFPLVYYFFQLAG